MIEFLKAEANCGCPGIKVGKVFYIDRYKGWGGNRGFFFTIRTFFLGAKFWVSGRGFVKGELHIAPLRGVYVVNGSIKKVRFYKYGT